MSVGFIHKGRPHTRGGRVESNDDKSGQGKGGFDGVRASAFIAGLPLNLLIWETRVMYVSILMHQYVMPRDLCNVNLEKCFMNKCKKTAVYTHC